VRVKARVKLTRTGLVSVVATTNWAVGTFALAASGMHYWCTERQRKEAQGMAVAVAGMKMLNDKKARERKAEEEAAAAVKIKLEDEKKRNQKWYKIW
jgi:Protein of unknown function (DUF3767)